MTFLRSFTLLAAIGLFTACEKSGSNAPSDSKSESGANRPSADASRLDALTTQSGVEMVHVPGGEFVMGSDRGDPDEAPVHKVTLSPFLMDKFEVTHAGFAKAQLPNPSHWQDNPQNPVERVRWRDAKRYCNERSLLEGLKPCYNERTADWECDYSASGYRLPTEAEWEYACRAESPANFCFGDYERSYGDYAWFAPNSQG